MDRPVEAVPEEVVRLRVNERPVATWSCTPTALEALATGRLFALGFIRSMADLLELRIEPPAREAAGRPDPADVRPADVRPATLHATVTPRRFEAALAEREHRRDHGCGLRFLTTCRTDLLPPRDPAAAPPPLERFPDLFRALFDGSASRRGAGGHHGAALSDGTGLSYLHEEVGRHNAVDKAIGAALRDGAPLGELGLVITARISGEIGEKAARSGLAWIASRSVPTTLAVEVAAAAGVPIVARAASPGARVFRPGDGG